MIFAAAVVLTVGAIAFTLLIRQKDVPEPEAATGYEHLEQRRARIYEQLRDLQFEFRVGKLSEADYQTTKTGLQTELAGVMAELDKARGQAPPPPPAPVIVDRMKCPHCGAKFKQAMKFCGECGKAIA